MSQSAQIQIVRQILKTKTFVAALLGLAALQTSYQARAESDFDGIRDELEDSFMNPKHFRGFVAKAYKDPQDWFCPPERNFSLEWHAVLDQANVELLKEGAAHVDLLFGKSTLRASGWRKGGVMCTWMGGTGTASIEGASTKFSVWSDASGNPALDVKSVQIAGLRFTNFDAQVPVLGRLQGDAPEWLNEFIETNTNALSTAVLASGLKNRINSALAKKLKSALEQFRSQAADNPSLTQGLRSFDEIQHY